jgi:hypothetical protein
MCTLSAKPESACIQGVDVLWSDILWSDILWSDIDPAPPPFSGG